MKSKVYVLYNEWFQDVVTVFNENELSKYKEYAKDDSDMIIKETVRYDNFEEFLEDCESLDEEE
jgi:hypothetical protein